MEIWVSLPVHFVYCCKNIMQKETTTLTREELEQHTGLTWSTEGPDENGNPYYSSTHGETYNIWYFHQDNGTDANGMELKANMISWTNPGHIYIYPETKEDALERIKEILG